MAYISNNLVTQIPRVGEGGSGLHIYRSADDNLATMIVAGYIDDGNEKGLKVNDIVILIDDAATIDLCLVSAIAANGDVTLINGT